MNNFNKNIILTFTILFSIFSSANICAQEIHKNNVTTHIFSIKNNDTLRMDIYKPNKDGKSNCVIFLFGGGFFTGKRDSDVYKKYFNSLTNNGYTVASIDYRLGLKEFAKQMLNNNGKKNKFSPIKFVKMLMNSINIAVEDLYSATNYLIEKSNELNINKDTIIISGSSAGAITVLQGEYYRTNWIATLNKKGNSNNNYTKKEKTYKLAEVLPNNFKYAGVIAFAGAIASTHGKIKWLDKPAPIQLFHGNADSNVPYNKLRTPFGGFYGSQYITNELVKIKSPFYLYTLDNQNHKVAVSPMNDNLNEINTFLQLWVVEQKSYFENVTIGNIDNFTKNKRFKLKDYIKSNFVGE